MSVIKSARRKTMALKVNHEGVFIHIPAALPLTIAQAFIDKKSSWIQQKLQNTSPQQPTKEFAQGEIFLFLGDNYRLKLCSQATPTTISISQRCLTLTGRINQLSTKARRAKLITWYKKQATDYLNERSAILSKQIGLEAKSITVKTYKARWGSCTSRGDIQYNWKIIQAPKQIIDYLIIHELCHLQQSNHSPSFWQLVERFHPSFQADRLWLKQHGYKLDL